MRDLAVGDVAASLGHLEPVDVAQCLCRGLNGVADCVIGADGRHLARYRALAKKYPTIAPERLLRDLVASTPAEPGKWFATAKTLELYELALELAARSPTDPKTLIRAARDHVQINPAFAAQSAWLALDWMAKGWGYELTTADADDACRYALAAARNEGQEASMRRRIEVLASHTGKPLKWMQPGLLTALARETPTAPPA